MSCMTITAMLLLSCFGATCTSLGVKQEPSQKGVVRAVPPYLTITEVRWLLTGTSATVKICTAEDLPDGQPTLVYDDGTISHLTLEGVIEQVNLKCATFSLEVPYKFTENPSRYELLVTDTSNPTLLGRGVTTFAITVRTTLLTCGGSNITKITWSASEELPGDISCLEGSSGLGPVCYHDGDITGTEFCFVVNDGTNDVNVCVNGPTDGTPSTNGAVSANYFYYGPAAVDNVPADATLSLAMRTTGLAHLRAIVRLADDPASPGTPGEAKIRDCSGTECPFVEYTRKFATYEVCVEAMDENLVTLEIATTVFTDLNLYVFDGGSQERMLLEFAFANGLDDRRYKARLYQEAPPDIFESVPLVTVNWDCTSVQADHACIGILETGAGVDLVHLALSAMDGSNAIIVPFAIP